MLLLLESRTSTKRRRYMWRQLLIKTYSQTIVDMMNISSVPQIIQDKVGEKEFLIGHLLMRMKSLGVSLGISIHPAQDEKINKNKFSQKQNQN